MFKHFLNFISLPDIGTIEIGEPIGFDKASYKVKQDDKRFGRDIIIANEDTELTFTRDFFEQMTITQILPNGNIFNNASLGFDYLIDIFNNEGYEGKIEYIIQKDNITFSTGIFSYSTASVEFDNIKVKIIQNTNREIIKRLEDTDINAFSDKALDGRTITPCETTNILLKSKPIIQQSIYEKSFAISSLTVAKFYSLSLNRNIVLAEIDNTLTAFSDVVYHPLDGVNREMTLQELMAGGFNYINVSEGQSNKLIKANTTINQINVKIKFKASMRSRNGNAENFIYYIMKSEPSQFFENYLNKNFEKVIEVPLTSSTYIDVDLNIDFNSNIILNAGEILYGGYSALNNTSFVDFNIINSEITFTVTSTSIDTIVKGVRLIDLVKHNVKSLADVEVIAPDYDVNGEHYDNFAFNGLLLGQITDKPFNNKFKELIGFTDETCSDYQVNPNTVEILPYNEFYTDELLAEFQELPSFSTNTKYNKRYTLKTADFKYKRSSSERETNGQNSIDDVHTETQKFITDTVDSNLKVEINHIRSAFLIEQARQRAFDNQQTTSLQNDDNLFLLKCVPLAPSSEGGFSAVLLQQVDSTTNNLKILNNNIDGDGIDFNWTLLGFKVGDAFYIDLGTNAGVYTVISITSTILELDKVVGVPTFTGEEFIKLRWYFTDVLYTNQTNEGYTLIEGVANPTDYSNLDYSWARNIQRWFPYLATATKFKPNGIIKTASFKTNGNLITQKFGESQSLADSGDIDNAIISTNKILNPNIHSVKVYAPFDEVTELIDDIQDKKGYVKVNLNDGRTVKGYVKELDYSWIKEELDLEIEEKFEGDFMEITSVGITFPQYPNKNNLNSFQINNNFVVLFDENENQMYPPVRFTKIKINGVQFTDLTTFTDALITLIG
jgi:signal peptidase I